jgi:hypothetical protein
MKIANTEKEEMIRKLDLLKPLRKYRGIRSDLEGNYGGCALKGVG